MCACSCSIYSKVGGQCVAYLRCVCGVGALFGAYKQKVSGGDGRGRVSRGFSAVLGMLCLLLCVSRGEISGGVSALVRVRDVGNWPDQGV